MNLYRNDLRAKAKKKFQSGATTVIGHDNLHAKVFSAIIILETGKTKYVGDFSIAAHDDTTPILVGEHKLSLKNYLIPLSLSAKVGLVKVVGGEIQTAATNWKPIADSDTFTGTASGNTPSQVDQINQVFSDGRVCITNQNGRKIVKDASIYGEPNILHKGAIIYGKYMIPVVLELPTGAITAAFGDDTSDSRVAIKLELYADEVSGLCAPLLLMEPAACPAINNVNPCNCEDVTEEDEEPVNTVVTEAQYALLV